MTTGVAVIGTGFGTLTHVRALRAAGFDVRALVGRDPQRTKARAERFEVPIASTSLPDVLAMPEVTAVTIATPPHTHAELALAAIAAGKHVVCEKPFARNEAEAKTVHAAAEAAGVTHLLGCEFRFASGQALMTRLVEEGAIGEPRLATFLLHIPLLAGAGSGVPDWWSQASEGGGWLGAQGSHVIDQVRTTLGEFTGVSASLLNLAEHGWTAEDTFAVHFRTANGCDGFMQSTASDRGPFLITSRIAGTRGTVWTEGDTVTVADDAGTRVMPIPDELVTPAAEPPPADLLVTAYDWLHSTGIDLGPYTRLFETFGRLIDGQPISGPAPATFADGVAAMRVMDAIRRSAADHTWTDLTG
ncbi:MAG TPA: Gfo/Idh/MocA family oxidoreductase [Mycobacteriales bacterium]|nr:Gfo/Idh/MocA family oxidoreductase [Mycobacteriales bacterium]